MARAGIKGFLGNRRPRRRHKTPTATDLVERMFTPEAPNRCGSSHSRGPQLTKARCTARRSSIRSRGGSWGGRPTRIRLPHWSPTHCRGRSRQSRPQAGVVVHSDHGVKFHLGRRLRRRCNRRRPNNRVSGSTELMLSPFIELLIPLEALKDLHELSRTWCEGPRR